MTQPAEEMLALGESQVLAETPEPGPPAPEEPEPPDPAAQNQRSET